MHASVLNRNHNISPLNFILFEQVVAYMLVSLYLGHVKNSINLVHGPLWENQVGMKIKRSTGSFYDIQPFKTAEPKIRCVEFYRKKTAKFSWKCMHWNHNCFLIWYVNLHNAIESVVIVAWVVWGCKIAVWYCCYVALSHTTRTITNIKISSIWNKFVTDCLSYLYLNNSSAITAVFATLIYWELVSYARAVFDQRFRTGDFIVSAISGILIITSVFEN